MARKLPLWHPMFDGEIGGVSRRIIFHEMLINHADIETHFDQKVKAIKKYGIIFGIVIVLILAAMAYQHDRTWSIAEKQTQHAIFQDIYKGNAKEVEKNKERVIAGAGGEGREMNR